MKEGWWGKGGEGKGWREAMKGWEGEKNSLELVAMIMRHVTREKCFTWQRCPHSVSGTMDYEQGALMVRY